MENFLTANSLNARARHVFPYQKFDSKKDIFWLKMQNKILKKLSPQRYSIRTRLIWLFLILFIFIFSVAGYFLNWQIRSALDDSLGKNLEAIAATIAIQIDSYFLKQIQPGDEGTRTNRNLRNQILRSLEISGVNRVSIFDKNNNSIVDSDSLVRIGQIDFHLITNQNEVEKVFQGFSASSTLFTGIDGNLYKTGYAPIKLGEAVIAGLAVDGSAEMLQAVTVIKNNMLWLGVVVMFAAVILISLFASRITTPLKKLENAANEISEGNLLSEIQISGKDEIGFLAGTMEQMRKSIIERDKRQQAMLAGVAHEIRNPLGGIELFSGLLESEVQGDELKNYASKISNEVGNLKKIIQGFLDYARPSPAEPVCCEIYPIFWEAVSLLKNDMDEVKIEFHPTNEKVQLLVDPQHLKQIFLNLIQNSIQAMSRNGTIFVKAEKVDEHTIISFADTGMGIPPELADEIFEPFFTTREKGTGLGLAVVKNLVEENGGKIKYIYSGEHGAHFLIEFLNRLKI
ncbi:HAMP domain-containing histidine kinase [candidate division KSB1 bacterium]|nr:HAMP domain-containing histidine kinase [candidate division KSB1 bacterium]